MTEEVVRKSKNRKTMLVLALVFILPIVLAKIALNADWFNKAATNKGELLEPPIELSKWLKQDEPLWRVVYVMPDKCDVSCDNALIALNQVWQAVGRERERVQPTLLLLENSDTSKLEEVSQASQFGMIQANSSEILPKFQNQAIDAIFIADTLGNVILHYPLQIEQQQAVLESRDILADLKKLLKLSRIG